MTDLLSIRKYAKERGYTIVSLPNHWKGYKYRVQGGRDRMYAYTLAEVVQLIDSAIEARLQFIRRLQ